MTKGYEIIDPLSINKLYTFFKKRFEVGYFFKGESHDFFEVVCVLSGKVGITAGKRVFVLNEGEMTFHPPGEFHAIRDEEMTSPEVIIFSFSTRTFPTTATKIINIGADGIKEISEIYEKVKNQFTFYNSSLIDGVIDGESLNASLTVKRLESFLLYNLSTQDGSEKLYSTQSSVSFYNILSVMEKNISKSLTVSEIANKCRISVPTLEKTVYKYLGYGAMTHYNTLKLQRAHTLLLSGASVKETADTLGYANQGYFSARFKKYYGFPPSSVRNNKNITAKEIEYE